MKKIMLITAKVILTLLIILVVVNLSNKQQYVENYLNAVYDFTYNCVDKSVKDNITTYTFVIEDERAIKFKAYYKWGKLNTPMGPTIIPTRICKDNLAQSFLDHVVQGSSPYNIKNQTSDEIYFYIKSSVEKANLLIEEYGVHGYVDDYIFEFVNDNGDIIELECDLYRVNYDYIKDKIEDELMR